MNVIKSLDNDAKALLVNFDKQKALKLCDQLHELESQNIELPKLLDRRWEQISAKLESLK